MNLRKTLAALAKVIADEADQNERFRGQVEEALGLSHPTRGGEPAPPDEPKRKGGRRTPAVLDPVDLARRGEGDLRARLTSLDLEQLRDIVAQYGMDPGKLVMKWRDVDRVVDKIVELAVARANKGNAFRAE
jgi:hypothetical protein